MDMRDVAFGGQRVKSRLGSAGERERRRARRRVDHADVFQEHALLEPGADRLRESLFGGDALGIRSEEHTSELQSLMRISYAVFCLKKQNNNKAHTTAYHASTD